MTRGPHAAHQEHLSSLLGVLATATFHAYQSA